ncbi:MAG: cyclodeaminase/cyclohydrolase family protein [Chloroflexota bacterium]|nr:cyclodeaminase/cyclohydrolase family protein [Chloroflexota bacterium]MDQ6905297.1 cyclodeaminase/cyclohydrolase family protein [Chloroflexota bacterium]
MSDRSIDLHSFLEQLASNAPTPGGGAASAYVGALGAASVAKVAAVSVGKPKFAAHDADLRARLDHLLVLRDRFLALADEDAAAFAAFMQAYRLPKATDEERTMRAAAVQEGMRQAAAVPLRIMAAAHEVLDAAEAIAVTGNPNALGDCGAGAAMAVAAMRVSLLNVTANIAGLVDGAEVAGYRAQLHDLMDGVAERERALLNAIRRRLAGETE